MRRLVFGAAALAAAMASGLAIAQQPAPPARPPAPGYLKPEQVPDGTRILAPPPKAGDPRYVADRAIYAATRKLEGTPRWALAQNDVKYDPQSLYDDFSCALGVRLTPQSAPRLTGLMGRLMRDSSRTVNSSKDAFKDPRPYLTEGGNICVEKSAGLADSPNYPSGHQGLAWAVGLALAELAPDRATAILDRARAYGESRVVCGVHTASAVEASRTLVGGMMSVVQNSPEFRADLEAARAELSTARSSGRTPEAAACSVEQGLLKTPW